MNQVTLYDSAGNAVVTVMLPFFPPTGYRQEPVIEFRGRTFVWCQDTYRYEERARFLPNEGVLHG